MNPEIREQLNGQVRRVLNNAFLDDPEFFIRLPAPAPWGLIEEAAERVMEVLERWVDSVKRQKESGQPPA